MGAASSSWACLLCASFTGRGWGGLEQLENSGQGKTEPPGMQGWAKGAGGVGLGAAWVGSSRAVWVPEARRSKPGHSAVQMEASKSASPPRWDHLLRPGRAARAPGRVSPSEGQQPWEGRCGCRRGAGVGVECFLASSPASGVGRPEMPPPLLQAGAPGVQQGLSRALLGDFDTHTHTHTHAPPQKRCWLRVPGTDKAPSRAFPRGHPAGTPGQPSHRSRSLAAPCQALRSCAGNTPPRCQVLDSSPQKCKKCNGNQGWPEDF